MQVLGLDTDLPGPGEEVVANSEENDTCVESFFEGFHNDTKSHEGTRSIVSASHGRLNVVGNADVRLTKVN